jgi:SWI/SNF-related matrix-associated actin-dependent regulator of chromatin subfamily A-like protein 1
MKPFATRESDGLYIYGLTTPSQELCLKNVGTYKWRADLQDETFLRAMLPEVEWPEPLLRSTTVGPDVYGATKPRAYQLAVRMFGSRLLLADATGLGKTVESLIYLRDRGLAGIVVCRAVAKAHWASEASAMGFEVTEVRTRTRWKLPQTDRELVIYHYEQLPFLPQAEVERWAEGRVGIVLDECHAIKNSAAQKTNLVWDLFHAVPYKVVISATPVRNMTADLWPQLAFLDPERFGHWPEFAFLYCNGHYVVKRDRQVLETSGTSRWDQLLLRMAPYLLKRTREEVGMQLPPITRYVMPLPLVSPEYVAAEREFIMSLHAWQRQLFLQAKIESKEVLAAISHYRHMSAVAKIAPIVEWLRERDKVVVITTFSTVAERIAEATNAHLMIGAVPPAHRGRILTEFTKQNRHLVVSIGTGGESLNLQSASSLAFVDLPWTPTAVSQAEERVWRPGQEHPVTAAYFVGSHTIEEHIIKVLLRKAKRNVWAGEHRETFEEMLSLVDEANAQYVAEDNRDTTNSRRPSGKEAAA